MKRSLPTLHEIIELQKQVMPPDTIVPVAASDNTQETGYQVPEQVQDQGTPKYQQEEAAYIFYQEYRLSTNNVIKAAWEKALLQYFKAKINNA